MTLLRIRDVEPLEGCRVRLTLTDGTTIERDLSALLQGPVFETIAADPQRFQEVRVTDGALSWPSGADLCPDMVIWGGPPPAESDQQVPSAALP
ncbi:MAG: DUF2442 domain-containing protein [Candidatus Binatia bacterium]|nr:DUF2442 domain-containing protein [Candidatus Binatia bacterium]